MKISWKFERQKNLSFFGAKITNCTFFGSQKQDVCRNLPKKIPVLLRFRQPLEAGSNPLSLTSNTLPVMSRTMQEQNPHVLWSKRWVALVAFRCFWFWYLFCFTFSDALFCWFKLHLLHFFREYRDSLLGDRFQRSSQQSQSYSR